MLRSKQVPILSFECTRTLTFFLYDERGVKSLILTKERNQESENRIKSQHVEQMNIQH